MVRSTRSRARSNQDDEQVTAPGERKGLFLRGADYLLSRLPFTKYKYQDWSRTKRIIIGYLLWLIVLPVIPLVAIIIMYIRDPKNFQKSPVFAVLSVVTVAWFGLGLGYVNSQVPVDSGDGQVKRSSLDNVKDKTVSESTNGRTFENCTAAFDAGVFDIKRSDGAYETRLDRDGDGVACER